MVAARMTSKGQLTVPKVIRDHLGLETGSQVEFDLLADGRVVMDISFPNTVMELHGAAHYQGPALSLEEMRRAIEESAVGQP